MDQAKPIATTMTITLTLFASLGDPYNNPTHYRSVVGILQYITISRPGLTYAVNEVCKSWHVL